MRDWIWNFNCIYVLDLLYPVLLITLTDSYSCLLFLIHIHSGAKFQASAWMTSLTFSIDVWFLAVSDELYLLWYMFRTWSICGLVMFKIKSYFNGVIMSGMRFLLLLAESQEVRSVKILLVNSSSGCCFVYFTVLLIIVIAFNQTILNFLHCRTAESFDTFIYININIAMHTLSFSC